MNIVTLSSDIRSSISEIRLGIPIRALCKEDGHQLRQLSFHQWTRQDSDWGDVFIFQRPANNRTLRATEFIRKTGKHWIYEIDDLLTQIPDHSMSHAALSHRAQLIHQLLRSADAIAVSTRPLADALQAELGPRQLPLHIVPNYSTAQAERQAPHRTQTDGTASLLIAASDTVKLDFILPAIQELQSRYQDKLKIVCIGPICAAFHAAGIKTDAHRLMPRPDFMSFIAKLDNPIGLIPLDNSRFSACKSAVKWFDYSMAYIPSACSDVSPYADVISNKVTGLLLKNQPSEWVEAIQELIESGSKRTQIGIASAEAVSRHHTLPQNMAAWRNLFEVLPQTKRRPAPKNGFVDIMRRLLEERIVHLREYNRARLKNRERDALKD